MNVERVIDVATMIEALRRPEAYAHPVESVEVHQTHISLVFLAGPFAYKVKKSVNLGFLDFSTLAQRKHFCEEEVRLNRRLAPQVYLGVIPIKGPNLRFGGDGPVCEWAVQMKRLPPDATLESLVMRDEVTLDQLDAIARRLAEFHRDADKGPRISAFGRFDTVAQNLRDNFTQTAAHRGVTVSPGVHERVRDRTEAQLAANVARIEARAEREVPRDTHGDLHLDHVYLFPSETPPDDLVIIDCIEFADRYRFADPVSDVAFLTMDLAYHGRRDLAARFATAYFEASGDAEGGALLPMYAAYRAVVRAKVEGMKSMEQEIDLSASRKAEQRARAYWLLALGELEDAVYRPALVMIAGLPGSGKSTLARFLAATKNFHVLRSDVVRKELTAQAPEAELKSGIYARLWTERTYAELLKRAEHLLWQGERVLIDANFREQGLRMPFFDAAVKWGVRVLFIHCSTTPEVARARLTARRGDASDADWGIYQQLAQSWQPVPQACQNMVQSIDTSGSIEMNQQQLCEALHHAGLLDTASP